MRTGILISAIAVGIGLVILNNEKSKYQKAEEKYHKVKEESSKKIKAHYYNSMRKRKLDKLFKKKKINQKKADIIYNKYKNTKDNYFKVNLQLKDLKSELNDLFLEKKMKKSRRAKIEIQKNIDIVIASRKELFALQKSIKKDIAYYDKKLKKANLNTRKVKGKIDNILGYS